MSFSFSTNIPITNVLIEFMCIIKYTTHNSNIGRIPITNVTVMSCIASFSLITYKLIAVHNISFSNSIVMIIILTQQQINIYSIKY